LGVQWLWSYFTGQRSSRLIAEPLSTTTSSVSPPHPSAR
jgi:hypothetical protein